MSRLLANSAIFTLALCIAWPQSIEQRPEPGRYQVDVDLVAVTFIATDAKGRPVHGLRSTDIRVYEDGLPQKIAAFAEGSNAPDSTLSAAPAGSKIFILFDTSDRMYRNIPYVCDAIRDLLRHLEPADEIAIYTFSRNLSRAAALTSDISAARGALAQKVSAGDDTALFNCMLLTLRDAAKTPGRKTLVVFSNGPDNKSVLSPEDVGTVAVNEGIPIYVISTMESDKDPVTTHALERLAERTGGQVFLGRKWQAQGQALNAIHQDIGSSYTVYYYPAPNPNDGFRRIHVDVASPKGTPYRIRARTGYDRRKGAARGTN
jgi:Ca-activated chloride channel homolog